MLTIAHGFGNSPAKLEQALASPVDMIEADIWFHLGRLVVRHERQFGPFPLFYDRRRNLMHGVRPLFSLGGWYMRTAHVLALSELVVQVKGKKAVMLDLKGNAGYLRNGYARALQRLIEEHGLEEATVAGYDWGLLRRLQQLMPDLKASYSVNTRQRLDSLWNRRDELSIKIVGLKQTLVTEEVLNQFNEANIDVYTWTVDDLARAQELRRWGVSGIISNDLELLTALRVSAA